VPRLVPANRPVLGQTLQVGITNLPVSAAFMLMGFSNTTSVLGPLPINLGVFGAPGCNVRVSNDAVAFLLGAGNTANWSLFVPNNPALACIVFYNQALSVDPGFNVLGAAASDAAVGVTGSL
jgi:hypothetical protein